MKRLVIGVIGHVDHGKTALTRALTGIETDRLDEERRRGISIVPGFAHMSLDGAMVDMIDLPGHERFVRAMIAGAAGLDAVLLVVAANEGVKPQTAEHADIAGLLGVRRTILAVTKIDLVDDARAAFVLAEASALAQAAGLDPVAALACSAQTGDGVPALKDAIARCVADAPPREDAGFPWLPIDRAFSIAGAGAVVTGTLQRGPLAAEDEVEIVPDGGRARLRAVQVHGAPVRRAEPGMRVAANLRGVAARDLARGQALAAPGLLSPSSWLSVSLRAVAGAPAPLRDGARLSLLIGTGDSAARLRLLDRPELAAGESCVAQLRCDPPVAVPARAGFVLRTPSPALVVAGGCVIDPGARRARRGDAAGLADIAALAGASPEAIVRRLVGQAGGRGRTLPELARIAGISPAQAARFCQPHPIVVTPGGFAITQAALDALAKTILKLVARGPVPRAALGEAMEDASEPALAETLRRLAEARVLRIESGKIALVRPEDDQARASQEAEIAARVAATLLRAGLSPPDPKEVASAHPLAPRAIDKLTRAGVLVRAVDRAQGRELLFHRDALEEARRKLAPMLAPPGLRVAEAGALLGLSRKYSVPLLEYFDAVQYTKRQGDRRVLARG